VSDDPTEAAPLHVSAPTDAPLVHVSVDTVVPPAVKVPVVEVLPVHVIDAVVNDSESIDP
jgi:hypothetical protein